MRGKTDDEKIIESLRCSYRRFPCQCSFRTEANLKTPKSIEYIMKYSEADHHPKESLIVTLKLPKHNMRTRRGRVLQSSDVEEADSHEDHHDDNISEKSSISKTNSDQHNKADSRSSEIDEAIDDSDVKVSEDDESDSDESYQFRRRRLVPSKRQLTQRTSFKRGRGRPPKITKIEQNIDDNDDEEYQEDGSVKSQSSRSSDDEDLSSEDLDTDSLSSELRYRTRHRLRNRASAESEAENTKRRLRKRTNQPNYTLPLPLPLTFEKNTSANSTKYSITHPFLESHNVNPFDGLDLSKDQRYWATSLSHERLAKNDSDDSDDEKRPDSACVLMKETEIGGNQLGSVSHSVPLGDVDPLGIPNNVTFDSIGGLDHYILQLKEMVMLPLMYPEVYAHFGITPPKGVLFHGPPGTGKTLMARALAASCSLENQKVTFYMRKGADCLSKWVGEAERQLRMLFEEAKNTQPSIIFFDEIDGLAPVRSSKQDQIHASIVATLLALMDGMDNRGQVILIGATNRPDAVDPALRRPGRFDREFYFPLPNKEARLKILNINMAKWPPLADNSLINEIAEETKGFAGADLRALCTEAALNAIQRTYPQLYSSEKKLLINPAEISVKAKDFTLALSKLVPSSSRSNFEKPSPLPDHLNMLLEDQVAKIITEINRIFPLPKPATAIEEAKFEEEEDKFTQFRVLEELRSMQVYRPRLIIHGKPNEGQNYIISAILHHFEELHAQSFDICTILCDPSRPPDVAVAQLFMEARRNKPSLIYISDLESWTSSVPASTQEIFFSLLKSAYATENILLVVVCHDLEENLPENILQPFLQDSASSKLKIDSPSESSAMQLCEYLVKLIELSPVQLQDPKSRKKREIKELPLAPIVPNVDFEVQQLRASEAKDRKFKNQLKVKLSALLDMLKRRYKRFRKPAIEDHLLMHLYAPDAPALPGGERFQRTDDGMIYDTFLQKKFYNIGLDVIEEKIWAGAYLIPNQFLLDIKKIVHDSQNIQDRERIVKAEEMFTNTQVGIEDFSESQFFNECFKMARREWLRFQSTKEKINEVSTTEKTAEDNTTKSQNVEDEGVAMCTEDMNIEHDKQSPIEPLEKELNTESESKIEPEPDMPMEQDKSCSGIMEENYVSEPRESDESEQIYPALTPITVENKTKLQSYIKQMAAEQAPLCQYELLLSRIGQKINETKGEWDRNNVLLDLFEFLSI